MKTFIIQLLPKRLQLFLLCSLLSIPGFAQLRIPAGTILPAELSITLNSSNSHAGQTVTAKIMQDVPLPSGNKIRAGSKIIGFVVDSEPASTTRPAEITIKFARIESKHKSVRVNTNLRTLASVTEVEYAQVPVMGADRGTPYTWATRELIGGQVAYGEGGPVAHGTRVVGRVAADGVIATFGPGASFAEDPSRSWNLRDVNTTAPGCPGDIVTAAPQALWLFSTDACGVYGMRKVVIPPDSTTRPAGEITLVAKRGEVKIERGSGMLLRAISPDSQ